MSWLQGQSRRSGWPELHLLQPAGSLETGLLNVQIWNASLCCNGLWFWNQVCGVPFFIESLTLAESGR